MPIAFACANCGNKLAAQDEQAGQTIECPTCRAALTVPAASVEQTYKLAEPEPPLAESERTRKSRPGPVTDYEAEERRPRARGLLSRGLTRWLACCGGSLLLAMCGVCSGGAFWLYFFNFTGSELVGTWETDPAQTNQAYYHVHISRFGHISLATPNHAESLQGKWRVLSKLDNTYTVEICNPDAKMSAKMEIVVLSNDRIRLGVPTRFGPREFRRM
jgi:hypothetical protein